MRILGAIAAVSTVLAGCGRSGDSPAPAPGNEAEAEAAAPAGVGNAVVPAAAEPSRWDLQSSGEGVSLALLAKSGPAAIRLFCPAGAKTLLVNVPAFRPVGSEERLSIGGGGNSTALVADAGGDSKRGGVSGTGAVPGDLESLVGGPISASYGAQGSGPHPAPPKALAQAFVAACRSGDAPAAAPPAAPAGACLTQDGKGLRVAPLRVVGTEPFWGARIEGRCVTYSHPDDQKGTRVWTRYTPGRGGGGAWSGTLDGRPFELRIRPQAGCSDGMSDRSYPLAAELAVNGERRNGCAGPG